MKKYNHSVSVSSDQNGGNALARISYFGTTDKERINVDFGKFHGNTKEEAIKKADQAVKKWISKNNK